MKIQEVLSNILHKTYGRDVRQSIHDAIEQCYKDATGNPESVAYVKDLVENTPYTEYSEGDDLELPVHSINDEEISKNSTWSSKQIVDMIYPIGSVYITVNNINPQTYLGGRWERFAKGQTLVGVNESDTDFSTVGKTGGEKNHILTNQEMPPHNHGNAGGTGTVSNIIGQRNSAAQGIVSWNNYETYGELTTAGSGNYVKTPGEISIDASHEHSSIGGGEAHNNMAPYVTAYIWKRTL